ncbi:hypothetical protein [Burkholderia sp. GbtcB21]|uniref:hypothetical protein n=1 Tax=Burkholderia sp. GbtcB21 TaxID=2824766 RepID=UPI001C2FC7B5|nr:hypothetical protein [Burkholderia sp. GbtcB21]
MDEREIADRESFVHWVSTEWRPDDGAQLLAKDWPRFAFAAWQAARRTTPDREAVITAAQRVVRDALDDVRVHPCDEHNDEMRANGLSELMYGLYAALKTAITSDKGGA